MEQKDIPFLHKICSETPPNEDEESEENTPSYPCRLILQMSLLSRTEKQETA
jgi:hypothetical protein